MRESRFIFDGIDTLYYDLNKVSLSRGGSNIDSPEWIKNKKATINLKNNDDKCFQYALAVTLIMNKLKRILKEYQKLGLLLVNAIGIDFSTGPDSWEVFERNNKSIALNILCVPYNTKRIGHTYKLEYNFESENQVILLIITDGKNGIILPSKFCLHCSEE